MSLLKHAPRLDLDDAVRLAKDVYGLTGTAHPLPAVASFSQIEKLVGEWKPASLVVGLPTSVQGTPHKMTRQSEDFARRLEKRFKLPVARVDERYTSVEAESRLKGVKNKAIDSVAAQLILEQFFNDAA